MKAVFTRPQSLADKPFHFCPGCHHGRVQGQTVPDHDDPSHGFIGVNYLISMRGYA